MIKIKIYPEEKEKLIKVIKKNKGKVISVAKLAEQAGLNPNRSRFIIDELIDEGVVNRVVAKAFNERWIRYTYEVK